MNEQHDWKKKRTHLAEGIPNIRRDGRTFDAMARGTTKTKHKWPPLHTSTLSTPPSLLPPPIPIEPGHATSLGCL
jgi:hypothetical protein